MTDITRPYAKNCLLTQHLHLQVRKMNKKMLYHTLEIILQVDMKGYPFNRIKILYDEYQMILGKDYKGRISREKRNFIK